MRLDDDYANAPYIRDAEAYPKRWAAEAESFRYEIGTQGRARLGIMYGHGSRNTLDLFQPLGRSRGLVVFVHGGYWMKHDHSMWSHLARGCLAHNWSVAMPSYELCPRVRIADITRQVADAVSVAAHEIPGPIILAGHSAGGHLATRMLDYGVLPDDVYQRLRHVMPISAIADLRPLLDTSLNDVLRLSEQEALAESPVRQPKPAVPVSVWVGENERPAFLDQSRWLAEAWGAPLSISPGHHHFDIVDGLAEADGPMVASLLQLQDA